MRAAAILGLGCSPKDLKPFQSEQRIEWQMGLPAGREQADVVVLFGGDGMIHRHLGPLVRLGLPVLVVPAGSGNDFARALGIGSARDALAAWQKFCNGAGNVGAIDLGVISAAKAAGEACAPQGTRYFCSVAGVGLDAEVARRANRLPRWLRGHGGYFMGALPAIFSFAPLAMKIMTSNEKPAEGGYESSAWTTRSDRPTILAAFANSPWYGGGMKIAPQAKLDDGLLDVCVVGAVDRFKLFCLFPTVYGGRHLKIREVEYFQAPRVRVETGHPLDVYADGEYVCQTPAEVSIERMALRVIVP